MSFAAPLNRLDQMKNGEMAIHGSDRGLLVEFFQDAVEMHAESAEKGYPVFRNFDFIRITQPGGKNDSVRRVRMEDTPQAPSDLNRFPAQWAAYKAEQTQAATGFAIEQWAPLTKAHVLMLKRSGFSTVEQIASVPDANLQALSILDARRIRDLALKFMEQAEGGAPLAKAQSEIEGLKQTIEIMKNTIEELAANQKKKPGRKPTSETDDPEGE